MVNPIQHRKFLQPSVARQGPASKPPQAPAQRSKDSEGLVDSEPSSRSVLPPSGRRADRPGAEVMAKRYATACQQLQAALADLNDHPNDPKRQEAAHRAHTALAQQQMPLLHRGEGLLRESMKVACAGPLPALGAWPSSALELAINVVALGPHPSRTDIQRAAVQWAIGTAGGALGELLVQRLAASCIERMTKQFRAVHPAAIVPDRMLAKMNRIRAGWGDELRAAVLERQREVAQMSSNSNGRFARKALGASLAVRVLSQPPGSETSLIKSVAVGNVPPGVASVAVAANIAGKMARAQIRVPCMEALERVSANPGLNRPEEVAMENAQTLPLFYVHQTLATERTSPGGAHPHIASPSWHAKTQGLIAGLHGGGGVDSSSGRMIHPTVFEPPRSVSAVAAVPPAGLIAGPAAIGTAVGVFALLKRYGKAFTRP